MKNSLKKYVIILLSLSVLIGHAGISDASNLYTKDNSEVLAVANRAQSILGIESDSADLIDGGESAHYSTNLHDVELVKHHDGVEIAAGPTSNDSALSIKSLDFVESDSSIILEDNTSIVRVAHESLVVQPQGDGAVRIQTVLESSESTHSFSYELDLEENEKLVQLEDGSIDIVTYIQDENVELITSHIEKPWAIDQNGIIVPTYYEINGNIIEQFIVPTKDNVYPIVADPFWIPAIIVGIRVGAHVVIKVGSRTVKYTKAPASRVTNALAKFQTLSFRAGSKTIKLDKSGMNHILSNHHPAYWNGAAGKTFFNPGMSVNDVKSLIHEALKQNSKAISNSTKYNQTYIGTVSGVKNQLSIYNGRVTQFYPR